jgi:hypothetical protein
VLSSLPRFAIDPARFEVRRSARLADVAPAPAAQYDLLVTDITRDAAAFEGFDTLVTFPSEDGVAERTFSVLRPRERPALAAVEPAAVSRDGAVDLSFSAPARVFRVEVEADDWPRDARLFGRAEGQDEWRRLEFEPLRPTEKDRRRAGAPEGQVYVLSGDALAALRLSAEKPGSWTAARIRVLALAADAVLPTADPTGERRDRRRQRRQ